MSSDFERLTFQEQLDLCQRHFWKTFPYATTPAFATGINTDEVFGVAARAGALTSQIFVRNPVQMRSTPTITLYNPATAASGQVRDETAGADCTASTAGGGGTNGFRISATGAAGSAVGNLWGVHLTADAGI